MAGKSHESLTNGRSQTGCERVVADTYAGEHGADPLLPRWWRTVDIWSIGVVIALFFIGIILSFASSPPLAEKRDVSVMLLIGKHVVFGSGAIGLMLALSMLSVQNARRLGCLLFLAAFVLLALLPFFGTDFQKGAVRWFSLGFASLQPSEFIKPGLIMVTAWLIAATREELGSEGYILSLLLTLMVVGLLVIQPDFGQSILVLAGWCVVYFVSGASMLLLYVIGLLTLAAGYLAYRNSEHFQSRIDEFVTEILGDGGTTYAQLDMATNAIINGGLLGMGQGNGTVKWTLPDAHTDLIIAVAAEEYGLAMVGLIVLLFVVLLWRSLSRLSRSRSLFVGIAGAGLITTFSLQALINLLVTVRLIPPKGMTLPFLSQGGSSLLAVGLLLGMLLALTRTPEDQDRSIPDGHHPGMVSHAPS